ncbi:MAG TPA: hypothetical protein VFZ65_14240 [Planctomycetota bacterium]|nr:hypothetical protein [Planctomycetota bacterium]
MQKQLLATLASLAAMQGLAAQSNKVSGLDGNLYDISSPTVWGRRGPAYPGGEIGFSAANYMCNPGTVQIPWQAAMQPNHPKFGFMIVRVQNDRMVQISDYSYIKHAFTSINGNSGPCAPCQGTGGLGGTVMGIGCYDVYGAGNNGDRFYLGPPDELDPWLGVWTPVGSYFDHGDPNVGGAAAMDGVRSLTSSQVNAFDVVKNRVTVKESELGIAGATYYYQIHLIHQGEALEKRGNNLRSRGVNLTWNGSSWSAGNVGSSVSGSVLTRWSGASYDQAANGTDDGQFGIAVKVTGPTNGLYHYEYAVQNIDNNRGSAAFRLPVCAGARVQNLGFRDIDANPLNDWTTSVTNTEIAFLAAAGNSQRWNQLFNFWFDCDVAPVAGSATFDEATPGPGALSFTVPTQVPGLQPSVYLGAGCGTPALDIFPNGVPSAGNASFAIDAASDPSTPFLLFFSDMEASSSLGSGCTLFLDMGTLSVIGLYSTNAAGTASIPVPVAPSQVAADLFLQAASFVPSPPLFGLVGLSNGLKVRFASPGCN